MWRNSRIGTRDKVKVNELSRDVVFQRVQLDTTVDQTGNNAEDTSMFGQLVAKALRQDLKFIRN
jgi:hypothetical protein